MQSFQFDTTKRIINDVGGLSNCATCCKDLSIRHPLIVTDKGIVDLGIIDELTQHLKREGIANSIFDETCADPSEQIIQKAINAAIQSGADGVIGIGGGSAMDCAKLVSVMLGAKHIPGNIAETCSVNLSDIYGIDNIHHARSPLILIPTTAGTGSEVTPIAIVTTGETTKTGVVSKHLLPDVALLDASLTLDLPSHITAATGIDAMVHALEAYTSKIKKNPYSDMFALQALVLLSDNIEIAVKNGKDLVARQQMMLGACMAGQAFANAPVGAVHALAYPLGGIFHVPHGLSNSLVLPHVIRFNSSHAHELYAKVCEVIKPKQRKHSALLQSQILADYFADLATSFSLPTHLHNVGVTSDDLMLLAEEAMKQQRLLVNNPRTVSFEDALRIYQTAL